MKNIRFWALFLPVLFAFSLFLGAAAPLPLLSPPQKSYLAMPRDQREAFFGDEAKRKELAVNWHPQVVSLDVPEKGSFTLTESGNPAEKSKTLTIRALSVTVPAYVLAEAKEGKLALCNLKIAAAYRWKCEDKSGEFSTEDIAPRLLKVDEVPNVRDLGGRMTSFGVRVKQGRIYRTAGMNSNASPVSTADAELRAKDPVMAHQLERLSQLQKKYRADRDRKKWSPARYLSYGMDMKWIVFRPDRKLTKADLMQLEGMTAIPKTLFGAKPQTVSANGKFAFCFPAPKPGYTAIFFRQFKSGEEGIMQVGFGADWYSRVFLNGEMILDLMDCGNKGTRMGRSNHTINLAVKKGMNLLVIPVGSGSDGWGLSLGPLPKRYSRSEVAKKLYEKQKAQLKSLAIATGRFTPGKNRFTPEGLRYFTEDLGVRSDLDLRTDEECAGMTGSPAGETVHWFHISSSHYGGLDTEFGRKAFTEDFKIFLDEKNYPIAFHCIAGQDRTGTLAFILNGLLGVPEDLLFQDWESTIFWNPNPGFSWPRIAELYKVFDNYPGKTINDRIESYVLARGFSKADVARFRELMLEAR